MRVLRLLVPGRGLLGVRAGLLLRRRILLRGLSLLGRILHLLLLGLLSRRIVRALRHLGLVVLRLLLQLLGLGRSLLGISARLGILLWGRGLLRRCGLLRCRLLLGGLG